jgi:hypothetical protein
VVRVCVVGTTSSVAEALGFFERCSARIPSGRPKPLLAPDFPGFSDAFRSQLALDSMWVWTVKGEDVDAALEKPPPEAFERCLRYWSLGTC